MLSRSQQKLLRKLSAKKYRQQYQMFVAEGRKVVREILREGLKPEFLLATAESEFAEEAIIVSQKELEEWSSLEVPDQVLGVFPFPKVQEEIPDLVVVLDGIKDPGNLGTIIRTCDWFDIHKVYCTTGTTDVFNAKTVQSTMGSIARVRVRYASNEEILAELNSAGYRILCADMDGESVSEIKHIAKTVLVMGSESHGPSEFWKHHSQRITIPRKGNSQAESLNVAVAAAIILSRLAL